MKPAHPSPRPNMLSPEVTAQRDGPNQFERFDWGFRVVIAVQKPVVLKDEARTKRRKKRAKGTTKS